jgi:hypothetical protein
MKRLLLPLLCALMSLALLRCSSLGPLAGTKSGSETTNGYVAGLVADFDSKPAANTQVRLVPADYDPVKDNADAVQTDTTDSSGAYRFIVTDTSTIAYTLEAVHLVKRTRLLIAGIIVWHDTVKVPVGTLRTPGVLKISIPDSADSMNGYLYIPGTDRAVFLSGSSGSVLLDSVPAGTIPAIYYAAGTSVTPQPFRYAIPVSSGDTTVIDNTAWRYAKRLYLNTTAAGANVAGSAVNFPVLVRLRADRFDFSQARSGGEDLRFAKSDGSPLSYEIERWDASNSQAEIWVKIDTVFGGDSSQYVIMYWGNPNATTASNGAAVFDTAGGFQGVWHLNDPVSSLVKDATVNGYNGTAINPSAQATTISAIGTGRGFAAGDSGYIVVPATTAGKLNFPENGVYAVSAWVLIDTLDGGSHAIADKGDQQYNLEVFQDKWEFAEYKSAQKWEMSSAPASIKQWTFVTGVRNQTRQYLYVNGQCVDSILENQYKPGVDRTAGYNVMFGKTDGFPALDFPYYFHGALDEIRMHNRAVSADWIKLCYMNQKADDRLILWRR